MGRGGKVGCNPNSRRRGRSKDKGSDDSDEDYVVSDEKDVVSDDSEDCGSFLDESASEKSFGDYVDEEGEVEDVKKVVRPKRQRGFSGRQRGFSARRKRTGGKVSRKRRRRFIDDDDDDDEDDDEDYEVSGKASRMRKRELCDDEDEEDDEDYEVSGKVSRMWESELCDEDEDGEDDASGKASRARRRELCDGEDEEDDSSGKASRTRRRELHDDEDEEDDVSGKASSMRKRELCDDEEEGEEDEEDPDVSDKASRVRKPELRDDDGDEDYDVNKDVNDDDEDEDEEFTPEDEEFTLDEDDCFDEEEEEFRVTKKVHNKKVGKQGLQRKGPVRGPKRRKRSNSRVSKKPLQKQGKKRRRLRRKAKSDDDDDDDDDGGGSTSVDKKSVAREKSRKNPTGRSRKKHVVQSDSDFVSSASSDFDFTISEEEREQIREASELCRDMTVSLRSSSSSKKIEDSFLGQIKWPPRRKGKEKIEEAKSEVGKQICGICLTEEDKRRVRGTLNCCSHYFCFTCIMAWSKVETRCPLCKQRFHSISKPARLNAGVDLRTVVMQVPERDQVYQPSEEEIRSYFDPYENVLCTECHLGGDDALMLLCDSCDSPAHTYCVGLGREVPEGNWYCEGCRPIALGSSSSQAEGLLADQRMANNLSNRSSPVMSFREGIDLNSFPSPHATSAPGFGFLSSPRHSIGDGRAASPVTGAGAPTLSGRRWVHRQIQNLLAFNRMSAAMANRGDGISAVNSSRDLFSSQINLSRETAFQPVRTQDTGPPNCAIFEERLPENSSPSVQNMDMFSSRINHLRRQVVQSSEVAVADRTVNGTLWDGHAGTNSYTGFEQLFNCNRPSIASDNGVSPSAIGEGNYLHREKEQVQSMVKSHLQSLSRDIGLDHSTLEDVARRSTHTTLAACGLEHAISEVCLEPQPFICPHIEIVAAGQTSLMKGCCQSCFDSFVRDVVKRILNTKLPQWLVGTRV